MTDDITTNGTSQGEVDFSIYSQGDYTPGRGLIVRILWSIVSLLVFESGWCPFSRLKVSLLRLFGAVVGQHVVIKPHVRIKFPWRLTLGDHVWIGQEAWVDNLAPVVLESHVCVSQQAYLCTGTHNHQTRSFDLTTRPITVRRGAWVCARAILLPGTVVGPLAIIAAGSVAGGIIDEAAVMKGNPAEQVGVRQFNNTPEMLENRGNSDEITDFT